MIRDERVSVLVTGVGGGGHGHEVAKALKLAGRYRIVGLDMSPSSYGLFDLDTAFVVAPPSEPGYIETLLEICAAEQISVLIHGSEPELNIISAHRERFREAGVLPLINTAEVIALCMDKWETVEALRSAGLTVPESALIESEDDLPEFPLPAVVKPSVGGGGSNNTFLAQDRSEFVDACLTIVRQGKPAIAQAYVGTPEDEYTVGVLTTFDGRLVDSLALNRQIMSGLSNRVKVANRTGREDLGPTLAISSGVSQGYVREFPGVRDACEKIASALGSRGPLNVQCRYVDGVLYPFEINPRFSGTSYIRALLGFNEPDLLIRHHVLGEPLPDRVSYRYGHVVRALAERVVEDFPPAERWRGA
ncbi:MAG: ATP-grasp domain-containing protein [Solirubrobacteraceae bacterium]